MNMLINLSVRSKIIILASTLIIAALTLTATGISSLQSIGNELHDITSNDMPLTKSMTSITEHQLEQSITMEKALRYGNVLAEEKTAREGYQKALEEFKKLGATVDEELKEAEKIAKQGLDTAHNKEQIEEFTKLLTQIIALEKAHASYDRKVEAIFQLVAKNNLHEAALAAEEVEKLEEQLNKDLSNVLAEVEKFTADAIDTVEKEEAKAISTMSIVTIVGMIIGVTLSLAIISSIVRGLNKAVSASERIAQGDLTQDLQAHSSDEIGKLISSMQHMQENLKNMLTEMNQSSTELAAASEELASVSEETNANTHNQQGEIDQMAAAMEQMSATVQEVAQNAASTSEFTKHANSEAETGARTVQNAAAAIEKLATSVASAAELLDALEKKSESISSVLDVIKSVAEQTNLLALNAAIEAARAGEQGRGFAVVADEVRILAQRTQQSTEEIEAMISSVQSGTADAVSAMSLSRDLASTSVEHARNCGLALDNITQVVAQINNMNLQIATAAEEQARVAEEVSANVCTISGIGQQNSAAANQTSSSSQELSQMAINLQELICKFKV